MYMTRISLFLENNQFLNKFYNLSWCEVSRDMHKKNANFASHPLLSSPHAELINVLPSPLIEFEFRYCLTLKVTGVGDHRGEVL